MLIRAETIQDYPAIGELVHRAFTPEVNVPFIIAFSRQLRTFDPQLSLVAEIDGRVVGHGLFMPQLIRLMDQEVPSVNLSPIAVDPDYQHQGIGAAIMREGHRLATQKGLAVSFLLGHDTYYPRFGYQTHAYGASSLQVEVASLVGAEPLTTRQINANDGLALAMLWEHEESNIDFAIRPSDSIFDWISPNVNVSATAYLRGDSLVGYTRIHKESPSEPLIFYAADDDAARGMAAMIGQAATSEYLTLKLHPRSTSAGAFEVMPTVNAWSAGMVCPLNKDGETLVSSYFAAIKHGERVAGRPLWGTQFELG